MKQYILFLSALLLFISCDKNSKSIHVKNILELDKAIQHLAPGDEVVMANDNVKLTNNTFKNNPIAHIAILWGEKNNHHQDNTVIDSGIITVEEQQKLKILY